MARILFHKSYANARDSLNGTPRGHQPRYVKHGEVRLDDMAADPCVDQVGDAGEQPLAAVGRQTSVVGVGAEEADR